MLDDPKTCIDAPAPFDAEREDRALVTKEVERRVAELSDQLRACSSTKAAEELDVEVEVGAAGLTSALVHGATVADCSLVDCVRKQLSGLQVAQPRAGRDTSVYRVLGIHPDRPASFQAAGARVQQYGTAPETQASCFTPSSLPPDVIRTIVRAQYQRFRGCYETALGRNRALQGRVSITFEINTDGKVGDPRIFSNELPDCQFARCVRDAFGLLEFPTPKGGKVTVTYPIIFQPG